MPAAKTTPAPRRVEYLRIDQIQRAPRNPKQHDRDGINASIDEHGLAELPLIDERTERLVAGHGRLAELEQMHRAGEAAPDGVLVDADGMWKMPVIRGWASKSDAHAEAYLLASNQTAMRGGWHDASLAEVLADLARQDFDLALVAGWDAGALEDLLAVTEMAAPPAFEPIDFTSVGGEAPAERPAPATPAGPVVKVHEAVPATSAAYAETPEQEAVRQEQLAKQTPRYVSGLVEMILIYTDEDRAEVGRLIAAARGLLGGDLKAAEVVLRALRTMTAVLDYRDAGTVDMRKLARAAGWEE